MAWDDEMTAILRGLINDMDTTNQTYSDDTLQQVIVVSAFQVIQQLDFPVAYEADNININITPDPTLTTLTTTRNESFINLTTQKAACIIDRGSAIAAANRALVAKDGASVIDLRDIFKAKFALLQKGWCAVYEETKMEYQTNSNEVAGAVIMTPFRTVWSGGGNYSLLSVPGRNRDGFGWW